MPVGAIFRVNRAGRCDARVCEQGRHEVMKIAILSRSMQAYSTRRLREACTQRGHTAKVLNTMRFSMLTEASQPRLFFRNKILTRYDAVIPRIGASISFFGTAVVRQFEQMGFFTLNSYQAI